MRLKRHRAEDHQLGSVCNRRLTFPPSQGCDNKPIDQRTMTGQQVQDPEPNAPLQCTIQSSRTNGALSLAVYYFGEVLLFVFAVLAASGDDAINRLKPAAFLPHFPLVPPSFNPL